MFPASSGTIHITELYRPDTPRVVKPWHEEVFKELRSYIILEYVKVIYPAFQSAITRDPRKIKSLFETVREEELIMFEDASDEVWAFCVLNCCSSLTTVLKSNRN
ncbi:unnamed protein product [Gongylonema pulchrum]|uniref:KIX domain-containing protein n=1 Tax=Gongylonema pulchrum TaxID=637853 RepID=A0A183ETY7_9BILA|nr:unnamed protein product [Gongylonema pulchrum]